MACCWRRAPSAERTLIWTAEDRLVWLGGALGEEALLRVASSLR